MHTETMFAGTCKNWDIFNKEYLKTEFEFIHEEGGQNNCHKWSNEYLKKQQNKKTKRSVGGMCNRLHSICLGGELGAGGWGENGFWLTEHLFFNRFCFEACVTSHLVIARESASI